jgi:hypothetical protein
MVAERRGGNGPGERAMARVAALAGAPQEFDGAQILVSQLAPARYLLITRIVTSIRPDWLNGLTTVVPIFWPPVRRPPTPA